MRMTMTSKEMLMAALLVVVLVLVPTSRTTEGAASSTTSSCNAKPLAACVPALTTGVTPSGECCSSMRAQQACLCQFAKNPAYARYVGNPNTRRTIAACGIARPNCS